MTNDKVQATGYQPPQDKSTKPKRQREFTVTPLGLVLLGAVLLILVAILALNDLHYISSLTARDHTISQQKKTLAADKRKISDLKANVINVENERETAERQSAACAAARDAWSQTTRDFGQETEDLLNNLFTPNYNATFPKTVEDTKAAKEADQRCNLGVNS